MHNVREFLLAAITDTQATIRAIDVKIAALLVAILAPLPMLDKVLSHVDKFAAHSPTALYVTLSVVFVASWVLAFGAFVFAIGVIDNPADHIVNSNQRKGSFYNGGLFQLGIIDVYVNRNTVKASKDPTSFAMGLPRSEQDIEEELAFELMKVTYIRECKMLRFIWGLRFASTWFCLGLLIYLTSRYGL